MPEKGVEPSRPCGQRILSPPRLPFRHSGAWGKSSRLGGLPQDEVRYPNRCNLRCKNLATCELECEILRRVE